MDVIVDHHVAVLKVLAFGNTVGGDEDVDVAVPQMPFRQVPLLGDRGEAGEDVAHVAAHILERAAAGVRAGDLGDGHSVLRRPSGDVLIQVVSRVCEGSEHKHLVVAGVDRLALLAGDGVEQRLQLCVLAWRDRFGHAKQGVDGVDVLEDVPAPADEVEVVQIHRVGWQDGGKRGSL